MEYTIDELISKFENGKERYHTDPVFNKVIDCLCHGHEPLKLLDDVMRIRLELQKDYRRMIEKSTPQPFMMSKDEYDKFKLTQDEYEKTKGTL